MIVMLATANPCLLVHMDSLYHFQNRQRVQSFLCCCLNFWPTSPTLRCSLDSLATPRRPLENLVFRSPYLTGSKRECRYRTSGMTSAAGAPCQCGKTSEDVDCLNQPLKLEDFSTPPPDSCSSMLRPWCARQHCYTTPWVALARLSSRVPQT